MHPVWDIIQNTVVITAFVAMMMLAIEYLNVITRGHAVDRLLNRRAKGYVAGILLGLTPGCLGAFVMVSLYAHRRVSIGAIVATMIATSGDEAFVLLGLVPRTALIMFAGMGMLGLIAGWVTDRVVLRNHGSNQALDCAFETHPHKETEHFEIREVLKHWQHPSATRAILSVSITLCIAVMVAFKVGLFVPAVAPHADSSQQIQIDHDAHDADESHDAHDSHSIEDMETHQHHNHGTGGWTWYMLVGLLLFGLFVVATVSEHFLEDHLWGHVLKVHVPRMFLWTLGALTFIVALEHYVNVADVVQNNLWLVLGLAVIIGLIPESGPHLVFVSLYAQGTIPLSILLASSIVQDGHGMVPLLAHSRRDFFIVKLINALLGALVGVLMLASGW